MGIENVSIDKIDNYFENPRHEIGNTEQDTLKKLIDKVGNQVIVNLAQDIYLNGLVNASLITLVKQPENDRYTVYEGNRRVAAIKLILYPEKFSFMSKNQIDRIKKMKKDNPSKNDINNVTCLITDEQDAFFIMNRLHSGLDKGRGPMSWTPKEKENFIVRTNPETTSTIAGVIAEKYQEYFNQDIQSKMKFTNINRLFSNIEIRTAIGLDKNKIETFTKERIKIVDGVIDEANRIAEKENVAISRIFNKRKIIEELLLPVVQDLKQIPFVETNDSNSMGEIILSNETNAENESDAENDLEINDPLKEVEKEPQIEVASSSPSIENEANYEKKEKTEELIPKTSHPVFKKPQVKKLPPIESTIFNNLNPSKCKELLTEIQSINISNYPLATAYLFRATIETLMNSFLICNLKDNEKYFPKYEINPDKKIKIVHNPNRIEDASNRKKIIDIKAYLQDKKLYDVRSLRQLDDLADFIDNLNLSIHWVDKVVSINEITTHWINSIFFIEFLAKNI